MAVEVWFLEVETLWFFMPARASGHKRDTSTTRCPPQAAGAPEAVRSGVYVLETPDPKGLTEWGDWSREGQPPSRVAR